jgi:hypothetical protein
VQHGGWPDSSRVLAGPVERSSSGAGREHRHLSECPLARCCPSAAQELCKETPPKPDCLGQRLDGRIPLASIRDHHCPTFPPHLASRRSPVRSPYAPSLNEAFGLPPGPSLSLVGLRPPLARSAASAGVVAVLASWIEHVRRGRHVGRKAECRRPGVLRDPDRVAIFAKASGLGSRLWVAGSSQPGHHRLDGIHVRILVVGRDRLGRVRSSPRSARTTRVVFPA